jgi:hypothetical protein
MFRPHSISRFSIKEDLCSLRADGNSNVDILSGLTSKKSWDPRRLLSWGFHFLESCFFISELKTQLT